MNNFLRHSFIFLMVVFSVAAKAEDLKLGAGDTVRINVYNNPDLSLETRVSESGIISYPLLGEVGVGGLSTTAASQRIADLLEKGGFIRKPQVNMVVTVMQSQQVSVLGNVNRPGRYSIDGSRTLTDLLALAGGLNSEAGDQVTLIKGHGAETKKETLDLVDMIKGNGSSANVEVVPGDVIYVERAPKFYIYGEVQKPGAYRLEKNMSVLQALSVGGGLTSRGTERGVRIKRRDENGKVKILRVENDDILKVDDVVYIKESLF